MCYYEKDDYMKLLYFTEVSRIIPLAVRVVQRFNPIELMNVHGYEVFIQFMPKL